MSEKKLVRLALSGSGFRFPCHVGALAAIEEGGYEVVELSGTSGGSIVGSLYASGKSVKELDAITQSIDLKKMLHYCPFALADFAYCNGSNLESLLKDLYGNVNTFDDLKIPLHVVASNLTDSSIHVFNKDNNVGLSTAVRASTAVPFLYSPIKIDDKWLVDGGITSNVPVEFLQDDGVLKLGISLQSDVDTTRINSAFDVLSRSANLLFSANDNAHIDEDCFKGAVFSFINTGAIGSFDTKLSVGERKVLYDMGYAKTKEALSVYESSIRGKRGTIKYREINKALHA